MLTLTDRTQPDRTGLDPNGPDPTKQVEEVQRNSLDAERGHSASPAFAEIDRAG